jgi:predicted permease
MHARRLFARLRGLFRNTRANERMNADRVREIALHRALIEEQFVAQGLTPEEASRQAYLRLGNPTAIREEVRQMNGFPLIETLGRDVGYALRQLRRSPGFAVTAILVMALGIGANVALFTVVRSVLLRPLPFPDPDRLVMLYGNQGDPPGPNDVAAGDFYDWQKAGRGFEQMAIWRWTGFNLAGNGGELPEFVNAGTGSWNLFSTLGVQPAIGRSFTADDDQPSAAPTAVLTWSFFQRRFNGNASIIGQTVRLNGKPYVVRGVLPQWFTYPDPKIQLWVPFQVDTSVENLRTHYNHMSQVVTRLRPGVSAASAVSEVSAIQHQLYLRLNGGGPIAQGVVARPMLEDVVGDVKTPLYTLLASVTCLLLIACLNLSNLLVARSAARRRETAIRTALGSSRTRLIAQQMTESLLICAAGGVLGMALATAATRWLVMHWSDMPRAEAVRPDWLVLAFAFGIVALTGIVAGVLPALSGTNTGVLTALQEGSRGSSGSKPRAGLRKALLTVEIALTVVLLVGSGLLFRSFLRLRSDDLGCATKNMLTMNFFLRGDKYQQQSQIVAFQTQLLEKIRDLPGVEAAGLTNCVPGGGYYGDMEVEIPEHPPLPAGQHQFALFRTADPGYFSTIGIPLIRGRFFMQNERMDNDKYVIVNQQFIREFFPSEDPLGKHLHEHWRSSAGENYEVAGVVGDTLYKIGQPKRPMMWFPILGGVPENSRDVELVVRTHGDPEVMALPVQKAIATLDPELPLKNVLTMEQIVSKSTANSSFSATLTLAFAGLSLLLAAVGLYGVLAYIVTQRTQEIGIRMALGAERERVLSLILLDGLRPALVGLALGIAASAAATRMIRSVLYGTSPLDATVFVSVITTLLVVALSACLLPAWRATRIDPMQALRTE